MEILTLEQVQEWTNIDDGVDTATLTMLEGAAIDHVEFRTNSRVRPYADFATGTTLTPFVPQSLKHAIALYISANYDSRLVPDPASMAAVAALCAPWRVWTL